MLSHNYGNPYEKWNIFVARPHLWLQLGMVKPEIMRCETVLNLSTLNTLTYLLTNILTSHVSRLLIMSVGVSALGSTSIHFIEPGVKVNGQYYREDLLMQKLLPDIRQLSDFYVFQQDSAPAHRARETIELLTMEAPEFIPPTLWPPNSPDLNPVDYKLWSIMQEKVYKKRIKDTDELHARILTAWDEMDQRIIDAAIRQWGTRLRTCIKAKGGHFEHTLSQ